MTAPYLIVVRNRLLAAIVPMVVVLSGIIFVASTQADEIDRELIERYPIPTAENFAQWREDLSAVKSVVEQLLKELAQEKGNFTPETKGDWERRSNQLTIDFEIFKAEYESAKEMEAEVKGKKNISFELKERLFTLERGVKSWKERFTTSLAQYRVLRAFESLSWTFADEATRAKEQLKALEEQMPKLEESRTESHRAVRDHEFDVKRVEAEANSMDKKIAHLKELLPAAKKGRKVYYLYLDNEFDAAGLEKILTETTQQLQVHREWQKTAGDLGTALEKEEAEFEKQIKDAKKELSELSDYYGTIQDARHLSKSVTDSVKKMSKEEFESQKGELQKKFRLLQAARAEMDSRQK